MSECSPEQTALAADALNKAVGHFLTKYPAVKVAAMMLLPCGCFALIGTGHTDELLQHMMGATCRPPTIVLKPLKGN